MKEQHLLTLQKLQEENNQSQSLNRIPSEKHQQSSMEITRLKHEIEQLRCSCEKFETHQAAMQQIEEDLHHQIQQLEKHIKQLTSSHQEEKHSYKEKINELSNKIKQTENDKSSLVQELQNAQSVCSSLEADNYFLRQRLDKAKHQLSTPEQEIMKLKNRLESRQTKASKDVDTVEYGVLKSKSYIPGVEVLHAEQLKENNNEVDTSDKNLNNEVAPTTQEVFAKGIKRKVDVEENCEKETVSLKDIKKLYKKPRTDKATKLATMLVKESNDDNLDINSLPDEVILEIFGYLKQKQLGQIAQVCRRWNVLTRSEVLWKKVNVQFMQPHRSSTIVIKSLINRLPPCVTSMRLIFSKKNGNLDFLEFCASLQEKCPRIEALFFTRSKFSDSFSSAIDVCTQFLQDVKKLVFCQCIFPDCRSIGESNGISKIEILDVFNCKSNDGPLNKPPFSRMPYLKELHLFGSSIKDYWFDDDISFLNQLHVLNIGYTDMTSKTFTAIKNHGLNLKKLCMCTVNLKDHDLNFSSSVFSELKTICLQHSAYVTCEGVVSLLHSCQSLQNVYVKEGFVESFEEHPFVVANRSKLEIVKHDEKYNHGLEIKSYFI